MWRNTTFRGIIYRYNIFADIGDDMGLHAGQPASASMTSSSA